ncbi:WD40 repeat domain-containing serine/threonine protein kinase [Frigoriglobus tundricola]|uniref:Protein kinase domain-containing protein n=1 Tax=Frigoriglobus tundricola TaxID=2774151 RepID=A0A6M5YSA6_9BACT|nr:serine/threonine-protein kinase [Frigoriglobus tundricola]QJW96320.1 hypothetical protein FTUN_3877 [Frigoriglobus tundricola]
MDGAPTFPSAAESLLRHLRIGVPRPAAPPAAGPAGFPHIPNYTIESELGRGGMGVVYLARHTVLRHAVAIKMILMAEHASAGEVARFVGEAEAVAAVRHPNVVQVYDLGEVPGRPYFVMEYVAGGTLARRIKTGGALAPLDAAALIEGVARGVQAAHDTGIVHRDLKPGNILLGVESQNVESRNVTGLDHGPYDFTTLRLADMTPKVSDFGLAKRLLSDATLSQAVIGTPAYMAPEQAGGKAKFVGPQADVYALGVVLYECLTARLPFDAAEPWALIQQVLESPPEPPRRRAPGVPRDLELICLKCLEKEPHHRYPTAAALADDLARVRRGAPVSVRPIGAPARVLRWAKKQPAQAALVAIGALLVLVVPALTVWVQGQLNQRAAVADEARQKEDAARRAEAEADKARFVAERLAEARELFALENAFRTRAAARPLGWTAATRAEVPRAVALAGGDPGTVETLRSSAAGALLAHDLFPTDPVAKEMTGSALATDPKSGRVAVGEFKAWGGTDCQVLLIDPANVEAPRRLTFPAAWVFKNGPLDPVQDGTRSLAYSPDGKRLYVGTRSSKVMRFDLDGTQAKPAPPWKVASGAVERLAVSPDGKTVYGLCAYETVVRAWDADTGRELLPRQGSCSRCNIKGAS